MAEPVCSPCEGWENPGDAGIALDTIGVQDDVDGEEEVCAETGVVVQLPKALPTPKLPSKAVIAHHNLTHIPYRSWCEFCVAARRNNNPHRNQHGDERTRPCLVADYCFLRENQDDVALTTLVGRVTPSQAMVAIPCDQKGSDPYATHRLRAFLKSEGITDVDYVIFKSDQERSLKRLMGDVITEAVKSGDAMNAVPESSAVGESQSNGRAEAAVQQFENQMRTLKAALEARLGKKFAVDHPVILWLVEHVASIINRHFVTEKGTTAYENMLE